MEHIEDPSPARNTTEVDVQLQHLRDVTFKARRELLKNTVFPIDQKHREGSSVTSEHYCIHLLSSQGRIAMDFSEFNILENLQPDPSLELFSNTDLS